MSKDGKSLVLAMNVLCEYAFDQLPDRYRLELRIEDGEGSLSVYDPDGNDIHYITGDSSWQSAIIAARDHARRCDR